MIKTACNHGDIAFMIFASTMVFIMTPAMALSQAGMIRRKNALSMLMQIMTGVVIGSLLYFLIGFSISFGPSLGGLIGTLKHTMLREVPIHECTNMFPNAATIPGAVFFTYQMMFAIHTPLITTGAWVEKMGFNAFLVFIVLWPILVYYPLSHSVWNSNGWLLQMGLLDYAGGIVIHTSSGVAGFVVSLMMQRRKPDVIGTSHHNLLIAYLGCALVFAGWYSFIAGAGGRANGQAVNAFVSTHVAACSGALVWVSLGYYRERKWRVTGIISGVFAGLGSITAAAGYVAPYSAMCIGIFGGALSFISAWFLKERMLLDDVLDCTSLQGIPGMVGAISIGFFNDVSIPYTGEIIHTNGLFLGGNGWLLLVQFIGTIFGAAWSGFWTFIILKIMAYTTGIDITLEEEDIGLDLLQMGEQAYDQKLSRNLDLGKETLVQKLIEACSSGSLEEAQLLVKANADPNGRDYDLRRPIHLACTEGRIDIAEWLHTMYKVDLDPKDRFGSTPMMDAYREKRSDIVQWLRDLKITCEGLDLINDLFCFSATGDLEGLQLLFKTGIDINTQDYDGRTALMVSASEGHKKVVRFLLSKHVNCKFKDRWGNTAAQSAVDSSYRNLAFEILRASKKKKKRSGRSKSRRRNKKIAPTINTLSSNPKQPLLETKIQEYGSIGTINDSNKNEIKKNIFGNFGVEASEDDFSGCESGDLGVPKRKQILLGTSELIKASARGDKAEIMRIIKLSKYGTALAAESDYDKRTSLHLAAAKGHLEAVKYLVSLPTVNINAVDRWKNTPLQEALKYRHANIVRFLRLKNAVIINQEFAFKLCKMAAEGNKTGLENEAQQGGDLGVADYDARTALHLASSEGHYETVKWLLLQGVHHTPTDRFGNTPLDDAKRGDYTQVITLLKAHEKVK